MKRDTYEVSSSEDDDDVVPLAKRNGSSSAATTSKGAPQKTLGPLTQGTKKDGPPLSALQKARERAQHPTAKDVEPYLAASKLKITKDGSSTSTPKKGKVETVELSDSSDSDIQVVSEVNYRDRWQETETRVGDSQAANSMSKKNNARSSINIAPPAPAPPKRASIPNTDSQSSKESFGWDGSSVTGSLAGSSSRKSKKPRTAGGPHDSSYYTNAPTVYSMQKKSHKPRHRTHVAPLPAAMAALPFNPLPSSYQPYPPVAQPPRKKADPADPHDCIRRVRILRDPDDPTRLYYADQPDEAVDADDSADFWRIVNQFHGFGVEGEKGSLFITAIEIVTFRATYARFLAKQKEFERIGKPTTNLLVFHGTKEHNVERIVSQGFLIGGVDAGVAALNGTAYGNGVYTSSKPATPIHYGMGTNRIVVADALTGTVVQNTNRMYAGAPFDCIHVPVSDWYIFQSADQLLPRFVVEWSAISGGFPGFSAIPSTAPMSPCFAVLPAPAPAPAPTTVSAPVPRPPQPKKRARSPTPPAADKIDADVEATVEAQLEDVDEPQFATAKATQAIYKQLKKLVASQMKEGDPDVLLDIGQLENLYLWKIQFVNFGQTPLGRELAQIGRAEKGIELEVRFGHEFPEKPPFVRVVEPRFMPLMQGGGGHITAGGSICFESLVITGTESGWQPKTDFENLLHSIRLGILNASPPPRIDMRRYNQPYNLTEAMQAYGRQIANHAHQGWRQDEKMNTWLTEKGRK